MAIVPVQLARVSNLLRSSVGQQQISRTQKSLLDVQNELTTGKRINVPSADPGDAAVAQQLRKTLEQRAAYLDNLKHGANHLGEVDSTLQDLTDLLREAGEIASANVGSDVTPEQRAAAAAIVESIQNQALTLANKQFEGTFLFAGDRLTEPPFVSDAGGVRFVGSRNVLHNAYDDNTSGAFMVDGDTVFGALSTRIEGTADLTPAMTPATRLADLRGATGDGVRRGSVRIGNGTTSAVIDLSSADTIGDVADAINAAGVGSITAAVAPDGVSLVLTGGGTDDITVTEAGGGTTAADLGILRATGAGAGAALDGQSVLPKLTPLTPLTSVPGLTLPGSMTITNGAESATIALAAGMTIEDLLNAVNSSGTAARAEINVSGTGINLLNPTQGTLLSVSEAGGSTATELGLRSYGPASPLAELNEGRGVRTVDGADLQVTDTAGVAFDVDVTNLASVQDVIDAINAAAAGAGAGVTASFATTGNGIVLTDTAGGGGTLTLTPQNFSDAPADLGLTAPATGNVIAGADVNPVKATGIFANLSKLRAALLASDQRAITAAAEGLSDDTARVARVRGETGARVQELEDRQDRLEDQNVTTKALLSTLEDTDYTEAITRFQTLQTALQASMQTTARVLNLSLMDFIG